MNVCTELIQMKIYGLFRMLRRRFDPNRPIKKAAANILLATAF